MDVLPLHAIKTCDQSAVPTRDRAVYPLGGIPTDERSTGLNIILYIP